jgi:hypothetical protein
MRFCGLSDIKPQDPRSGIKVKRPPTRPHMEGHATDIFNFDNHVQALVDASRGILLWYGYRENNPGAQDVQVVAHANPPVSRKP